VRNIFGSDLTDYWIEHPAGLGVYMMARLAPKLHQDSLERPPYHTPIHDFVTDLLGPPSSQHDCIKLQSQAGFHASLWMSYNAQHFAAPGRYVDAIRMRANCMIDSAPYCTCGQSLKDMQTHAITCNRNTHFTGLHRHNEVLFAVAAVTRKYGVQVTVEPSEYIGEDARRQDITFCLGSLSKVTDLTIVDPTAKSYSDAALANPGITALLAGNAKELKHSDNVAAYGHHFVPMAVEVFGHMDQRVDLLLRSVSQHMPMFMRKSFVKEATHAIALAVQLGNAGIAQGRRRNRRSLLD
jgi:hypothetical protein